MGWDEMKIYTKIGDQGKTTFFGCGLVAKDDPRIVAFGALDELNSTIGLTLCFVEEESLRAVLTKIQHDLFQLGADLVGSKLSPNSVPRITSEHVLELEAQIDQLEGKLGMPKAFILPGGTKQSAFLHLCRVITRRAERDLVKVKTVLDLNSEILRYINRLSDFMYVLARQANKEVNIKEQQPIYKYLEE
jgi:cob(I)alamin adenosyltransferase